LRTTGFGLLVKQLKSEKRVYNHQLTAFVSVSQSLTDTFTITFCSNRLPRLHENHSCSRIPRVKPIVYFFDRA